VDLETFSSLLEGNLSVAAKGPGGRPSFGYAEKGKAQSKIVGTRERKGL